MGENVKGHGGLRNKIKNMPIKKTMVLFIVTALLLSVIAGIITIVSTHSLRSKYSGLGNYEMVNTISAIVYVLILMYIIVFIVIAVYLFYNMKLRQPIKQLLDGTEQIAHNALDFTMDYRSQDELGQLCASFEKMKTELRQSNARMWRAAEDRKKLSAVFAHDLRTPLTVLRGYTGFLEEYIPAEQMQPEKLLQTIGMMSVHIERIEHYVDMMAKIQRVEDTPISPAFIEGRSAANLLQDIVNHLNKQTETSVFFTTTIQQEMLKLDMAIVQRVLENLLANSMRYAKSKIEAAVYCQDPYLYLSVIDDGTGFSQDYLDRPFTPFYQEDKPEHFGLGLNICKTLCQIHGGNLKIANVPDGGAFVLASFKIR